MNVEVSSPLQAELTKGLEAALTNVCELGDCKVDNLMFMATQKVKNVRHQTGLSVASSNGNMITVNFFKPKTKEGAQGILETGSGDIEAIKCVKVAIESFGSKVFDDKSLPEKAGADTDTELDEFLTAPMFPRVDSELHESGTGDAMRLRMFWTTERLAQLRDLVGLEGEYIEIASPDLQAAINSVGEHAYGDAYKALNKNQKNVLLVGLCSKQAAQKVRQGNQKRPSLFWLYDESNTAQRLAGKKAAKRDAVLSAFSQTAAAPVSEEVGKALGILERAQAFREECEAVDKEIAAAAEQVTRFQERLEKAKLKRSDLEKVLAQDKQLVKALDLLNDLDE